MLPELDGFELCRQIRQSPVLGRTPVLFLTARSDEVDRVLGFEIGGDDYMTKPFSPRELIARVKAHLRREELDAEPAALEIGPFRLDRTAHRVFLAGAELELTSTEFNLLDFFLTHPGRAYSREQLLEAVWGAAAIRHAANRGRACPPLARAHRRAAGQPAASDDSPRIRLSFRGKHVTGKIFLKLIAGRDLPAAAGGSFGGLFRDRGHARTPTSRTSPSSSREKCRMLALSLDHPESLTTRRVAAVGGGRRRPHHRRAIGRQGACGLGGGRGRNGESPHAARS